MLHVLTVNLGKIKIWPLLAAPPYPTQNSHKHVSKAYIMLYAIWLYQIKV